MVQAIRKGKNWASLRNLAECRSSCLQEQTAVEDQIGLDDQTHVVPRGLVQMWVNARRPTFAPRLHVLPPTARTISATIPTVATA